MTKRRISKASKRRLTFFGTISLIAIIYFCFSLLYNIYTIYVLSKEMKQLENLYVNLQEETEDLKINIEKLNDNKYLADYARKNYLYSKPGEYIIQMDDVEQVEENISNEIKKNYLLLILSSLILLIFIYIILKSKKKSKKTKK